MCAIKHEVTAANGIIRRAKQRLWNLILKGNFMLQRIFILLWQAAVFSPRKQDWCEMYLVILSLLIRSIFIRRMLFLFLQFPPRIRKNLSLVLLLSPLLENMFVAMLYARGVALNFVLSTIEMLLLASWEGPVLIFPSFSVRRTRRSFNLHVHLLIIGKCRFAEVVKKH